MTSHKSQVTGHKWQLGVPQRVACHLLLVTACVFSGGCVRRSLTIRSDPPGALVYVNDQLKGTTPLTYDFQWYGGYRVTLRKDGYDRLDDRRVLRAPVYLWIPFDLAMELLPVPVRDTKTWIYTLTPAPTPATPMPPQILQPAKESSDVVR